MRAQPERMQTMDPGRRTLAGRYRLEHVIGRGGMSTVYRATDTVLGRTVAVKVLLASLADEDPAYVARFRREARAAAALHHAAVVAVYDFGVDGDTRFIVMEHVEGRSVAALLRGGHPLPLQQALLIGAQVAEALGAAHAAGIVHRDIKPANLMVEDGGAVKVLDFGVARMLDMTTITQAASVLGTAAYMAPERALGGPGDARSDVYSLGCLLYAMLTGAPPFRAEHAAAVLHQHLNSVPSPAGDLRAGVPPEADALVAEMLAKDPADRPPDAKRVGERLAVIAQPSDRTAPTRPIAATAGTRLIDRRPPPPRGRQALAAALVTLAVALAVVLVSSGGGASRPSSGAGARTLNATPPTTSTASDTGPSAPTGRAAPVAPAATPKGPAPPGHGGAAPPGHRNAPPPGHLKPHGKHGKGGDNGGGGD
jgi:eukaryotic-like serine/threonine-protein kinase